MESTKAAEFTCEVCFELRTNRLPLAELKTGNGDVLRSADCGHGICLDCMASHVVSRVGEQRVFDIRCPHEGCKNQLFEQDLCKLPLPTEICRRFAKLRSQDYTQRVKDLKIALSESVDAIQIARALCKIARLCPRCSVVIQKSEGCNSFYCVCGHHFQYDRAPTVLPVSYLKAVQLAEQFNMSIDEAELRVGQGCLKARRIAVQMGVSLEEALALQKRAKSGDEAAIAQIRAARKKA